ncbi:MAG: hypothetical protein ABFC77_12465 [Thermoguttaceae bacterium]
MTHLWHEVVHFVDRLGPQGWSVVLAAMIGVAFLCLRGFGSRSRY